MQKLLIAAFITLTSISNSYAHSEDNIPAGVTVIHLQETASEKVAQDRVQATLRLEKENYDVSRLQNSINKIMKDAITKSSAHENIEINTGTYRVYKTRKSKDEEEIWHGEQSLMIEGADKAKILELVATLQSLGFAQSNLNYVLSPKKKQEVRTALMEEAISHIQSRAKSVSKQLSMPNIRIVDLNLQDHLYQPTPRGRHMEMMSVSSDMKMTAPVLESSGEIVKISVHAKVYLKSE